MAINVNSKSNTLADLPVEQLAENLGISQGEPTYVEQTVVQETSGASTGALKSLYDEASASGEPTAELPADQVPQAATQEDLSRLQTPPSSLTTGVDEDGQREIDRVGEDTRWKFKNFTPVQIGNPLALEDRIGNVVDNFKNNEVYFGTTPAPEGAPTRYIPQAMQQIGVTETEMDSFLTVGALVTEEAISDSMFNQVEDKQSQLDEYMGSQGKVENPFPSELEEGAVFRKANLNYRVGKQIANEYQKYKTGGAESEGNIGKDEATALGDAFLEIYASSNPDMIERTQAETSNSRKSNLFKLNAHGADILNNSAKRRKELFPSKLLRARKTPHNSAGPETKIVGQLKGKGGALFVEAFKNLGSIGNVVIPRRGKILLMSLVPTLMGQQTDNAKLGAEINKVGSSKVIELRAKAASSGIVEPAEVDKYVQRSLAVIQNTTANALFGIATERRGANYLDYYLTAFNNRLAPQQTLFDPTSFKQTRFVTGSATPAIMTIGSRIERNYRQMVAMHLVKDADMKLPKERDKMLREAHSQLYRDGKILRDLVNQMDNGSYEAVMDAIEKNTPISDPIFKKVTGLNLDPNNSDHATLMSNISKQGEDGMMYIDGLIDYANYHDAMYNPSTRGKSPQFATYFNAYMDGKTNGLAANAMVLGVKRLAYSTGVIRESKTDLLDNGDIRDDVEESFKGMLLNHDFQLDEETNQLIRQVALTVNESRQMHKDSTMTYGYGMDPVAFEVLIDNTVQKAIADGNNELASAFNLLENRLTDLGNRPLLGSRSANLINTVYQQAVVNSLSPEMLEARKLMKGVALMHGFTDELFEIDGPLGRQMRLTFGGKIMQDFEDATQIKYSKYELDEETGEAKRSNVSAVRYDVDRVSTAAPKKNYVNQEVYGLKGANGSVVGAVQATDSATLIKLHTGRSWERLNKSSNGNPYLHTIHDAIKVDAMSYDVVLDEVNKLWLETCMNYNYVEQAHKALDGISSKFRKDLQKIPKDTKVPISEGSKYQMIGYAMESETRVAASGKEYTVYPNLEKYLKLTGVPRDLARAKAWEIVAASNIYSGSTATSPVNIQRFLRSFADAIKLTPRLRELESTIDSNKKSLYPMFAKQKNNGRWVATADDIYQYYAH